MRKLRIILQSNLLWIILIIFLSAYVFYYTTYKKSESVYKDGSIKLEGYISDVKKSIDTTRFTINAREKLQVYYSGELSLNDGEYIALEGNIESPKKNTIPNNFNYRDNLYNKRIYKIVYTKNISIMKSPDVLNTLKNKLKQRLESIDSSGYLKLFIMGNKEDIDSDQYTIYKENGIAHLLAISGMHVSFLVLFLNKILSILKDSHKNIVIVLVLSFYVFITSYTPSILRCFTFFLLSLINKRFKLSINNIKVLILCAGTLLLINPFYIFDIGFLYSYVISLGIMLCSKYVTGNYFVKIVKISIVAMLFSLPITININCEYNLFSILTNIILVPFVTFIFYPLSIVTAFFPFFGNVYHTVANFFIIINSFLNLDMFTIIIPKMNIFIIFIYYLCLLFLIRSKRKFCFLLIPIILFINYIFPKIDYNNWVLFLDVGQGDSSLIVTPHQKNTLLIDTGGDYSKKRRLTENLVMYLKSIGISKIDCLILTHGDYDHMGEAINLVENFKVEEVIFNCGPYNDLEQELIKVLDKKKIKYYSCIKELNIDNKKLYFLQTKEYDNENDNSNVIYTELNGYKFMFMGDASTTTEQEILKRYNLSDIDVLKVGHHGSKTSSSIEFINEINPKYSIVSVGKNNRYGHPNKEVLNILDKSKIYRTDQDGSIMFKIKNNKLKIETCSP